MIAKITVTLKTGLLDAQGKTVKGALDALGFKGINELRIGKYVEIELHGLTPSAARAAVDRMCQQVLANPVIETYHVEIEGASGAKRRLAKKAHAGLRKAGLRRMGKASVRRVRLRRRLRLRK